MNFPLMAKKTTQKITKSMEETLWDSANKLRGTVESSEYKHVVLGLIFLKFASDKFEERRAELIAEGKEKYLEMKEFYNMKNVFFLAPESRWSHVMENSKQDQIALIVDTALHTIEKNNPSLKGALPDNYFSRLAMDPSKLAALLDTINNIDTVGDKEEDVVGRIYEYFLGRFAAAEGKGGGEFYTPKSIVNLIAEMLEPYKGKIYDPCCGSGGMFVQSIKFVQSHQGNTKDISIYGQEFTAVTYKLAKMNLAIRGIAANLGEVPANTFFRDQHPDLKADFILANPPFNQSQWREKSELEDDPRWSGFTTPPTGNANYAWMLHMLSKLSENGTAGFVMANGSMSSNTSGEGDIRRELVEKDLVDCMIALPGQLFYTTQIPVCLWFVTKNKSRRPHPEDPTREFRDRRGETLFIDARQLGTMIDRTQKELTKEDIDLIASTYHNWRNTPSIPTPSIPLKGEEAGGLSPLQGGQGGREGWVGDIPGFCKSATLSEIAANDYVLTPGRYVGIAEEEDNGEIFEEKMIELTATFKSQLAQAQELDQAILENLKGLGYE
ncbi:class I SAM-dependent DNA methyltransferase [Algoriphagus sp. CAU 1675]|uniref:class I SAM-dependent DNA methyltransferase n=1 Tax=Algoriphagus sp. CAU 1675 TaxID=3032597 RepID=UPI0023DBB0A2|nr:class I SAM-dependent DNA methyltransferase [Algoriphagus sp. CAU 1675]MDF2156480.1 class I SAM-dependent DNA methyltransferase [Algoriphagus sp. CAU 1675]